MNILLIGTGGRSHALAWKLKQSKLCGNLFIAPGNAGTALEGTNLDISVNDFDSLKAAVLEHNIAMLIVGPEEPLVNGIVDYFLSFEETQNLHIIGPPKKASQLEGSKAFAKDFMQRHQIPTAAYSEFTSENYDDGIEYIKNHSLPIVLKADGLASGKGVLICNSHLEAMSEFDLIIHRSKFGEAGKKVVIEAFLEGIEVSVFVLTDGENYVLLPEAKDYKRIGVADTGLNTGGMGAVSPVPFVTPEFLEKVKAKIVEPTIAGLKKDNMDYKGFIFLGLMVNNGEPNMIEYNCRLGDPETEVVIPRLKNDLVELLIATSEKRLNEIIIDIDDRAVATVVIVSEGYPGDYTTGKLITGLDNSSIPDTMVFHSATNRVGNDLVTNGGRVLAVTAYGENITEAVELSNYMAEQLHFEGMYFRTDIGYEFKDYSQKSLSNLKS